MTRRAGTPLRPLGALALVLLGVTGCRESPPPSPEASASASASPVVVRSPRSETVRWTSGETRVVAVTVPQHALDPAALAPVEKAFAASGLSLDRFVIEGVRQTPSGFTVAALPLHHGVAVRKDLTLSFTAEGKLEAGQDTATPPLDGLPTEPATTVERAVTTMLEAALATDKNPVGDVEAELFYEKDEGADRWRLVWGVALGGAGSGFVDAATGERLAYEPGTAGVPGAGPRDRPRRAVETLEGITVELTGVRLLTTPTAIFFVDDERGYAVGDYGRMIRTDDGGETFRTLESPTDVDSLQSAWFTSREVGFIGGVCRRPLCAKDRATLLLTRDGGESFRLIELDSAGISGLWFASPERGFGIAQNAIWTTADAGETWQKKDAPRDPAVRNITLAGDALVGSAPGGVFYASTDLGATWVERGRIEGRGALPTFWLDETHAVARDAKALYWTRDGGRRWEGRPTDLGPARQIWFVDDKTGFAIARDALLGTRDGGAHWKVLTDPKETGFLSELHFPTPRRGFAIGRGVVRIVLAATD